MLKDERRDGWRVLQQWGQPVAVRTARWRSVMRWRRAVQRVLAPFHMTFTQWLVLDTTVQLIEEKGDAVSQNEVAARLEMSKMTVSHAMTTLANKGLVDRGPDMHMPAWRIFVFEAGKNMLRSVGPGIDAVSRLDR